MNGENEMTMEIAVNISQKYGGHLTLHEDMSITVSNFQEMCHVLGQFAELAKRIKREKSGS